MSCLRRLHLRMILWHFTFFFCVCVCVHLISETIFFIGITKQKKYRLVKECACNFTGCLSLDVLNSFPSSKVLAAPAGSVVSWMWLLLSVYGVWWTWRGENRVVLLWSKCTEAGRADVCICPGKPASHIIVSTFQFFQLPVRSDKY